MHQGKVLGAEIKNGDFERGSKKSGEIFWTGVEKSGENWVGETPDFFLPR